MKLSRTQNTRQLILALMASSLFATLASAQTMTLEKSQAPKFSGDFRYRHEEITDDGKKDSMSGSVRARQRLRLRLRMDAKVTDEASVIARIATGDESANSTNQSLDGGFSSKGTWIDLAYLKLQPKLVEGATLQAGKMTNPFTRVGKSQLVWDSDVNPEGVSLGYDTNLSGFTAGVTGAYFWVNELSNTDEDLVLQSGEIKLGYTNDLFAFNIGAAIHAYQNLKQNNSVASSGGFAGNLVQDEDFYANDYRLHNYFSEVKIKAFPMNLFYDYVVNEQLDDNNKGWLAGFSVGKTKGSVPVQFSYNYRKVESDAVVAAFNDSDFIGGGTDGEGHTGSIAYGVTDSVKVGYTHFLAEKGLDADESIDYQRGQADIAVKF